MLKVHRLALEVGQQGGKRRGDDLVGFDVATATAGGMPMKNNSGVIRKPPPTPNHARQDAHDSADSQKQERVDRYFGNRQVKLHVRGHLVRCVSPINSDPSPRAKASVGAA